MKKSFKAFIQKVQNKAGYVSIETVVIAGLMIALGATIMTNLDSEAREVAAMSVDKVYMAMDVDVTPPPEYIP